MRGIYKAAWGLAFLMVAIAAQEVALRLAMPSVNPANHIRFIREKGPHPILGPADRTYRQIKNTGDFDVTVHFNHYGLREGKDIAQATEHDIILVGDSYAFGWGVEESDRVSNRLSDLTGTRVYNVSVTGNFDTYEKQLNYAADIGAAVKKVVLMVTMENDIFDYSGKKKETTEPQAAAPTPNVMNFISFKERLMTNSALYFLLTSAVHQVEWIREFGEKIGLIAPNLGKKNRPIPSDLDIRSSAEKLLALSKRYRVTIVVIPSRFLWHGNKTEALGKVHEKFIETLRKLGIDTVDLRPAFEGVAPPLSLHFRNDPHWTTKGHALAAKVIAEHMEKSGL